MGYAEPVKMLYTGQYYQAFVELGVTAELRFFLTDGPDSIFKIFPDIEDANPSMQHQVSGWYSSSDNAGAQWKIGIDSDETEPYKRYEIKAFTNDDGVVTKVT